MGDTRATIWDNPELLKKLENQRALRRLSGGLTFDCMRLKCKDNRAFCSEGRRLGQSRDGSMALISVLRGITSGMCRDCRDFITEE